MRDLATAPLLIAALVLCVAGAGKLRTPRPAARALADAGLPSSTAVVRAFAAFELALGCWSLLAPGHVAVAALSATYFAFAVLAAVLARRAAACGCFGSADAPATATQVAVSVTIGALSAVAVVWHVHGIGWVLGQPTAVAGGLLLGVAGAAYATVLAYTELPSAWSAWSRA